MSRSDPRNPAASIRDRLLTLARERGEDFQRLLTRYGLERLLYRLSRSPHRDRFVLNTRPRIPLARRGPAGGQAGSVH